MQPAAWRFLTPLWCAVSIAIGCLLDNDRNSIYVSVFEDAKPGSLLAELPIQGTTFGPEPDTQLRLVKGNDFVDLDARKKTLILKKSLDRDEGESKFEVIIECKSLTDSDFPQINISTFVSVKDVNDNAPQFDSSTYRFSVPEELPIGTVVFMDVQATDHDRPGPNSYLHYRILPSEGPSYLAIEDSAVPVLTVAGRIDFEKVSVFEVSIEAKDDGDPPLSTVTTAFVTVTDVDDLNPVFKHDFYYATFFARGALDVSPERILAVDGDSIGADIEYFIQGELSEHFAINSSGHVSALTDTIPSTVLLVKAVQSDNPERYATAVLRINNETFIHFELSLYSVKIMGNAEIGSELIRTSAVSPEKGAKIAYSLNDAGEDTVVISVHPSTGSVRLVKSPMQTHYSYRISANDGKRTAWCRIDLYVEGNHEPVFDKTDYAFEAGPSPLIGQVRALDADGNDTLKYRIVNLQKRFSIDDEGWISRLSELPSYSELVILCEDSTHLRAFTTVVVRSAHSALSMATLLTVLIFLLLIIISLVIITFVIRRLSLIWRREEVCWMSKTGDNGIVISASLDSDHLRTFSSRHTARTAYESEEKDRECASYSNTSAFVASPPSARVPLGAAPKGRPAAPTVYF